MLKIVLVIILLLPLIVLRVVNIDFDNILSDKKSYKTYKCILIYKILYKTFMVGKPLLIRFDEIDGYIKTSLVSLYTFYFDVQLGNYQYHTITCHRRVMIF